ncbi:MAG: hypothetical protein CBC29_08545 [Methylococcaceae bacterium TMED69]|nr:MAG: hypothetical protein CBC29_08545 [Methylococcaceae bacterium TMED69]
MDNRVLVFLKYDCPTCELIRPLLADIQKKVPSLEIIVQDDRKLFPSLNVQEDNDLEISFNHEIEIVPTAIKLEKNTETVRLVGWDKKEWKELFKFSQENYTLPDMKPGCGSKSVEPGVFEKLAVKFGGIEFRSRNLQVHSFKDEIEFCFERGWSDGLPVVPPTKERVFLMLQGTKREPSELLGLMPPNLQPCTIEKVAINAVMAGCKPEFLPVVIAAVEAALDPAYCLHGLLATTWLSGPIIVVNGDIRKRINMNWKGNVLGQGNRANSTIGRALQLTIRNVGGGKPQEVDQATFGTPSKLGFCIAEDESTPWTTLAEDNGFDKNESTVTLLSSDGPVGVIDQISREPEGLIRSISESLKIINHIDMANASDTIVIIGPEHGDVFDRNGWDKKSTAEALYKATTVPAGGDFGMITNDSVENLETEKKNVPKFRSSGITLIRAGGAAGLFSAVMPGWLMNGESGTNPVTKEIKN